MQLSSLSSQQKNKTIKKKDIYINIHLKNKQVCNIVICNYSPLNISLLFNAVFSDLSEKEGKSSKSILP